MSPVANHPSTTDLTPSGSLWYPCITLGPLTMISPSAAILISEPGSGGPTVPKRVARGLFRQVNALVSVRP